MILIAYLRKYAAYLGCWFHVSDRFRVHVYKRHIFKQFETLSKLRAWSESRLFANILSGVTTSGDLWSKTPTISKQTTGILSGRTRRVGGHDVWKYTLHMKNYMTAKHSSLSAVCRNIIFNNKLIIWGFSRLVFKVIQMYQSSEILFFALTWMVPQATWLRSRSADLLKLNFMIRCDN